MLARGLIVGLAAAWAMGDGGGNGSFGSVRGRDQGKHHDRPRGMEFRASPDGLQEVQQVDTPTRGRFKIRFNEDMSAARFELKVFDGMEITQAHLHCAPAGVNGPVVVFLFGLIPGGFDVHGELAKFTLTDANVAAVGANCVPTTGAEILNLADLAAAAAAGDIYVNVHSIANPGGEIRGQLRSKHGNNHDDDDDDDDEDNDEEDD
jgi:hypothetical protein